MSLFDKLQDVVPLGFNVKFSAEALHLYIEVSHKDGTLQQALPISDYFTEDRVIGCINFMIDKILKDAKQKTYEELAKVAAKTICIDPLKEKLYIEFLEKHNLPNSGPTPELMESLNKPQREELAKIITGK